VRPSAQVDSRIAVSKIVRMLPVLDLMHDEPRTGHWRYVDAVSEETRRPKRHRCRKSTNEESDLPVERQQRRKIFEVGVNPFAIHEYVVCPEHVTIKPAAHLCASCRAEYQAGLEPTSSMQRLSTSLRPIERH
jgi:hypothetical protein